MMSLCGSVLMRIGPATLGNANDPVAARPHVAGRELAPVFGEDGRAVRDDAATPTTEVALSAEDYVVLSGGRRGVEATDPEISGDEELGRRLLASLAVTP